MIYKSEEWQGASDQWYCNCLSNLKSNAGAWYIPARILNISPAQFIELLITEYKPDHFHFDKDTGFCCWSWTKQADMRKYKNWINSEARKVNFQV